MKDLWQEPKHVRNSIKRKAKQIRERIALHQARINELEPWLAQVRRLKELEEKELAQLQQDYNIDT